MLETNTIAASCSATTRFFSGTEKSGILRVTGAIIDFTPEYSE